MKKETISVLGLLLTAFIWGSAFIAIDEAQSNGWQVFPILTVRAMVAGIVLLPFAIKQKFWKNKKGLISGVFMGVIYYFAFICQTLGQEHTSIVNTAFLTVLYVAFAPLILKLIFKEKQQKKIYIGCLLSVIGVFCLTILDGGSGFKLNFGDALVILGALFFAIQIVAAQKTAKYCTAISTTTVQMLTMGILSLISMPIAGQTTIRFDSTILPVLYCALFSSALASYLQIACQRNMSSSKASIIMALETLIASILSFIVSMTLPSIYVYIGSVFMFLSIIVIEVKIMKKLNLNKYKYILIDVDDTLLDFKKSQNESIINAFRKFNKEINEEVLSYYTKLNTSMWKSYEKNEITTDEIFKTRFQKLSDHFNLECNGIEIEKLFRENLNNSYHILEGTIEFLEKVKDKYELIIVTNGKRETQYSRLKLSGLDKYFKYIFISEEVGYKKPEVEFFNNIENTIEGFDKTKAIIIGDSLTSDIQGGINYNIDTCLYNINNEQTDAPEYIIKNLNDIIW